MTAGHADHFLSRLDRVSWQQMEYALALYNDAPMLKHVLSRVKLAPDAERVALSLEHPTEGPFVIVTRDAKFVTCLGRGMRVSNVTVIERARLDAIIERQSVFADASRKAAAMANGDLTDGVFSLLQRVFEAGPRLSREELSPVLVLAPIIAGTLLEMYPIAIRTRAYAREALIQYAPSLKAKGLKDPGNARIFEVYTREVATLGHLAVMLGEAFAYNDAVIDGDEVKHQELLDFFFAVAMEPYTDTVLRACWGIARIGLPLLPQLARRWATPPPDPISALHHAVALIAMSARNKDAREQIASLPAARGEPGSYRDTLANLVSAMREQIVFDALEAEAIERAKFFYASLTGGIPKSLPDDPALQRAMIRALIKDVPEDPATSLLASLMFATHGLQSKKEQLIGSNIYFSQRPAQQMYLPRASVVGMRDVRSLQLEGALSMVYAMRDARVGPSAPRPRAAAGRNDPCPCNSGKKYKRCCGA